ncbi:thiamine-phosphate kinase [Halorubellus sp. JP-L1]|uniref:thiamine-phosphate kinase n=1 Tax=Halorubellus sp. JP-L1 TaxID=2715753 RepID=UPI0014081277|nr:thiamine-phosphate kinase [Halorubellus sp. JP-L1]NHN42050.1 thiamine-phosphate kinase [Halorubellus sp. JP-L1]
MDERAALDLVGGLVGHAGDDAAVVDGTVVTTDMLHETTDFPPGTTRYTAGWRAVGASLSDVAAMGARATAAVAVYAAPRFDGTELERFVEGAKAVCERVDAAYVGGDLDGHEEFTVASTALGETTAPVYRDGATAGDVVCVTGELGRSAAALRAFDAGDVDRANDLFQFTPRVAAGRALAGHATAMMDSSDGLARSLHQLASASDCAIDVDEDAIPVADAVSAYAEDAADAREMSLFFGEDFELVATLPADAVPAAREACPTNLAVVGEVNAAEEAADGADGSVTVDGDALPNRGFTHGA